MMSSSATGVWRSLRQLGNAPRNMARLSHALGLGRQPDGGIVVHEIEGQVRVRRPEVSIGEQCIDEASDDLLLSGCSYRHRLRHSARAVSQLSGVERLVLGLVLRGIGPDGRDPSGGTPSSCSSGRPVGRGRRGTRGRGGRRTWCTRPRCAPCRGCCRCWCRRRRPRSAARSSASRCPTRTWCPRRRGVRRRRRSGTRRRRGSPSTRR